MHDIMPQYEHHLFKCHRHQCSVCLRSFAAARLLSIHVSELHDSYFQVLAKKKPCFQCLVEGCEIMSWSDKERGIHLRDYHKFPKSFDFHNPKKYKAKSKNKGRFCREKKEPKTVYQPTDMPTEGYGGNRPQPRTALGSIRADSRSGSDKIDPKFLPCDVSQHKLPSISSCYREKSNWNGTIAGISTADGTCMGRPGVHTGIETARVEGASSQERDQRQGQGEQASADETMDVITEGMARTAISIPSKISFGRRSTCRL